MNNEEARLFVALKYDLSIDLAELMFASPHEVRVSWQRTPTPLNHTWSTHLVELLIEHYANE